MWKSILTTLSLFVTLQLSLWTVCVSAEQLDTEVKTEVVFKPEDCTQRSKKGDLINAHYDGFLLKDGSQFYCSRSDKDGHPQWFVLGVGQIIKGLDIGMIDMCPGEKRKITVPSELAFGEKGKGIFGHDPITQFFPNGMNCSFYEAKTACKGPVPPNATVFFEVEVYAVSRGPRTLEAFRDMDLNQDKSLTKDEVKEYLKQQFERDGKPRDEDFYQKIMADIFHKNDQDRDGQISVNEYNIYRHDEL